MIWGVDDATVLGLAGIIASVLIAAFGYWYNYATRSQPYQQFLYQKQMEAYSHLSSEIAGLLYPCYKYLDRKEKLTPKNRLEFQKIADEASSKLIKIERTMFIILPRDVRRATSALLDALAGESLPDYAGKISSFVVQERVGHL